jgi:hypothetical protein
MADFSPYFHGSYKTFSDYAKPQPVKDLKEVNMQATEQLYKNTTPAPESVIDSNTEIKSQQPEQKQQSTGEKMYDYAKKAKKVYDMFNTKSTGMMSKLSEADAVAAEEGWGATFEAATEAYVPIEGGVGAEATTGLEAFSMTGDVAAEAALAANAAEATTAAEAAVLTSTGVEAGLVESGVLGGELLAASAGTEAAVVGTAAAGAAAGAEAASAGSTVGTSVSSGLSSTGIGAIVAAIIMAELYADSLNNWRNTDPESGKLDTGTNLEPGTMTVNSGNLFEGSFQQDPFAIALFGSKDTATAGEIADAYLQMGDWGGVAAYAPATLNYWVDPIGGQIKMASDKYLGTDFQGAENNISRSIGQALGMI